MTVMRLFVIDPVKELVPAAIVEAVEVLGQPGASEDTAGGTSPAEDEFEVDEDTLPRPLADGEGRA